MAILLQHTANIYSKSAIHAAGGGTLALAIAMAEDQFLIATPHEGYPYGDKKPNGEIKVGNDANFGIFKMNWYMIQRCPVILFNAGWWSMESVKIQIGERINNDPGLATRILIDAMKKWSPDFPHKSKNNFWAGHRWGESGIKGIPPTDWPDILDYYNTVKEIQAKCDSDHHVWESDVRYYSDKKIPDR